MNMLSSLRGMAAGIAMAILSLIALCLGNTPQAYATTHANSPSARPSRRKRQKMSIVSLRVLAALSLALPLMALGLLAVPSAHATTTAVQADGGIVWCNGNPSSTTPAYSLTYSDGNGGTLLLPATVQAPDGPNPNDIPDAWQDNNLLFPNYLVIPLPNPPGPGETAETTPLASPGDPFDRYVMQLDYWNSVGSGLAVQQWDYNSPATNPGVTVAGAVGYSTGDSCEVFYPTSSATANAGQFTITYPANPSTPTTLLGGTATPPTQTETQWVAANPTAFPYNGYVPYSGGNITGGGPTGYVSIYKGCGWDQNSCTAGSATLTPTNNNPPPNPDWNVFPERLSTVTSIPTTWAITNDPRDFGTPFAAATPPQHIWDASYDIWFDTTGITGAAPSTSANWGKGPNQYAPARGQNDGLEIMVWMDSNGSYVDGGLGAAGYAAPSGWKRGQVLINNVVYDVWTSRLNNPYYGAYSTGATLPAGAVATSTYSNETLVKGGADPDTCTNLQANGGPQYGTCGTEWNVVSFVATAGYRGTSMSMDTKVFTDYILGISDGGLWQDVAGNVAGRNGDGILACPLHAAQVQYNTALTSASEADCLEQSWWLTSIDAGFEPWLGGNGLESKSFVAHVNTYASPVQSGLTSGDGTPIVAWNSPFEVVYPGCRNTTTGLYTEPPQTEPPTFTIAGINGVEPYYPFLATEPAFAIPAWVPLTITGPGNYNGYGTNNLVLGTIQASATVGQQMTWNPTTQMFEAVVQQTLPLSAEPGNGAPATIYIYDASCASQSLTSVPVYIDPSGKVFYSDGATPVQGATVTLEYSPSDSANGPFEPVPNNNQGLASPIMEPADNTLNPMSSTQYGNYAWDVAPGYYEVNAEKSNCGSVTSPVQHVTTIPITNLFLDLPCAPPAPAVAATPVAPATPAELAAGTATSSTATLTWNAVLAPVNATSVTYTVYETSPASTVIASGLLGTTYTVTGLNPNTSYTFAVAAVDSGGSSPESEEASITTQSAPGGACHVVYNVTSAQPGVTNGLTVNINIQNTGKTAIYPWTLSWTFPGNQKITNTWNVNESLSGENVSLSSTANWESIPAGGTLYSAVGFNGSFTGTNATPAAFYLNGQLCQ